MAVEPDFEWHPARLLQSNDSCPDFTLLILNQPLRNGATLRKLWRNSTQRVAADGGANRLYELSTFRGKFSNLHAIIGDLDSLKPSVRDFYSSQPVPVKIIHDASVYMTDFAKAITWIREGKAPGQTIVALGGIGGRVDQGLSQLHHLYAYQNDPEYQDGRIFLLSSSSITFLLKPGTHDVHVQEDEEPDVFGKHVGIIPLRGTSHITTQGLEWDVTDWETSIGGNLSTSNHVLPDTKVVRVKTNAEVLFTIALRQIDEGDDS